MTYTEFDYTGPTDFVHLHNHSIYSTLDGVATIDEYAKKCLENNWSGMSLTEHGHMGSVPDLYLTFRKYKLKPIFGCEIYYNDWEPERQRLERNGVKIRSVQWRQEHPVESARLMRNRHLTVLCKNETGFHNLIKLTTQAYATGLFGLGKTQYNRIWFEKLCEYKEGLIILSGCLNGPVSHELRYRKLVDREGNVLHERSEREALADAAAYVKKFKRVFGDDYYMELQMPGIPATEHNPGDVDVFKDQIGIANFFDLKLALANDCHYLHRKDYELQKIMMAIAQGTTVDSPDLFHVNSDEQYLKTRGELWARFKNEYSDGLDDGVFNSMCDTTMEIFEKCERFDLDANPKLPEMPDADDELKRLVAEALTRRGLHKNDRRYLVDGREVTYVEQAKIELNRFVEKGYSSYFMIPRELVRYGKEQGWPFYPRGSAGGSLVCFLLGIHPLDPLKWGLSFDRFLSPSRGGYMLDVKLPEPVQ